MPIANTSNFTASSPAALTFDSASARLAFRSGDVVRAVQQVRDDEWHCTSSTGRSGIVSINDFDLVTGELPNVGSLITLVLQGDPRWAEEVFKHVPAPSKRVFVFGYVSAFENVGEGLNMLRCLAFHHVAASRVAQSLFFFETLFCNAFTEYAFRFSRGFLAQVIAPLINVCGSLDVELQPSRMAGGQTIEKTANKVARLVLDLVDRVTTAAPLFPAVLRIVLRYVDGTVAAKYGQQSASDAAVAVLFGWIANAVVRFEEVLLSPVHPVVSAGDFRRAVQTMADVLVSFVSPEEFTPRRPHLSCLDSFRANCRTAMAEALSSLVVGIEGSVDPVVASMIEKVSWHDACVLSPVGLDPQTGGVSTDSQSAVLVWLRLHRLFSVSRDRISSQLSEKYAESFRRMVENLGPTATGLL
jgi:hypothetical protein